MLMGNDKKYGTDNAFDANRERMEDIPEWSLARIV